jgi:tRNA A-37 threonylcarbamoyl transferase component Bud32
VYGLATSWEGELFVSGSVSNEAKEAAREGLKQIHSCGVLHGDLEARNLVVWNNRITFIDFGNARCQEECDNQWQSLCEKEEKRLDSLLTFI